jgi:hypothetical protein
VWAVGGATGTAIAASTSDARRISWVLIPTWSLKSVCRPPPTSTQPIGQPGATHSMGALESCPQHGGRTEALQAPPLLVTSTAGPCASTVLAGSAPCPLPLPWQPAIIQGASKRKLPGPAHRGAQQPCRYCGRATAGSPDSPHCRSVASLQHLTPLYFGSSCARISPPGGQWRPAARPAATTYPPHGPKGYECRLTCEPCCWSRAAIPRAAGGTFRYATPVWYLVAAVKGRPESDTMAPLWMSVLPRTCPTRHRAATTQPALTWR